jgi:predicted RNA-binding Zn ribbon-like protein
LLFAGFTMRRPPRYDLPRAAPQPLRLVQLFVNTTDHERSRELLGSPEDVRAWLADHIEDPGRIGPKGAERARALREALRQLLSSPSPDARAEVEESARRARLTVAVDPPRLVPQATGLDHALGELVAVAYQAMRDGSWKRLKTCRNCGFSFWDASRNRSATWCSMQLCGNRLKVRRYRRRRSATSTTGPG